MENSRTLVIRNESDAFALLEDALSKRLGDQRVDLKFEGWPVLEIKLKGEGYQGTITADMAQALVELQHAMNRVYARAVRHTPNARKLTIEERDNLKFKAKVTEGSSLINVDLGEFAGKLSESLIDKMTPDSLVMTIVGVSIVAGGTLAYKWFLNHRAEERKLSEQNKRDIALSEQETKRLEIVTQAMQANKIIDYARQDFDVARHEIVRGTADATSLAVNGVGIDRETARVIAMAKRSESKDVQLNGNYYIRKVDWQVDGHVRLTVASVDAARVFAAGFRDDSLNHHQTNILKDAEWRRSPVYLSINATELRGEITTATIVAVTDHAEAAAAAAAQVQL